ncbi:hypothetical protein [Kitasatospora sp. NPDC051914]|uniref:hypothetical protein n=1 Tax=Kitasatospora sp. NPDC051914 TaxID=3154945 RepID=UPI00343735D4
MGRLRQAAERAVTSFCTDRHGAPAADRRAATGGAMLSHLAADHGHPVAAAVISTLGAAAVAADTMFGHAEPPEGGYAGFTTDGDQPKRRWFR